MATVIVTTELAAPADVVFGAVRTVDAFELVTAGLVRYAPTRGRSGPIPEGEELRGWLLLGGVLPISRHRLRVERIDPAARVLLTDEGGGPVRRWRHRIEVTPLDDGRCRYSDEIDIDAGALTPLVRAFAEVFYRARQRRWRRLAPLLAAARTPADAEGRPTSGS